ncbi:hypothetical protein N8987_07005, partial [Crocinitomix sp.]|nr:hypothetical protein [Crocinitomix sp.]
MSNLIKNILFIGFILSTTAFAQVNQKDSKGRKQGVWKKPYENSTAFVYVGQFKDDIPVGQFTYYYESGKVKIIMNYLPDGKTSYAQMYHETGYMMARGKYLNQE